MSLKKIFSMPIKTITAGEVGKGDVIHGYGVVKDVERASGGRIRIVIEGRTRNPWFQPDQFVTVSCTSDTSPERVGRKRSWPVNLPSA